MNACDLSSTTYGHVHSLWNKGIQTVGRYLSPNSQLHPSKQLTKAEADAIHSVGMKIFSIWEVGATADSLDGFGWQHGIKAANYAKSIGQPSSSGIYWCADWDSSLDDYNNVLLDYAHDFRMAVESLGYLPFGYLNGLCGLKLLDLGLIHGLMTPQSTGYQGYHEAAPRSVILQGPTITLVGLEVDTDTVQDKDNAGLW